MTAFEDYVNLELPRRSALLTNAITSYDGDPNDGGAPAIIQNSPLGTFFREETADKWWRKTEADWEEVGATSSGVMTIEPLIMAVDYTLGISPDAGLRVTSQADYDTLVPSGYLKYPQDALDILPSIITDYVQITLNSGLHYPKPDSYAPTLGLDSLLFLGEKVFDVTQARVIAAGYPDVFSTGTIQFDGSMQVEDAEQAGTSSSTTLTRDAGTWTPDEHKGRFVEIKSGSGSGDRRRIVGNSATELFVSIALTNGANTFEIIEPAAKLVGTGSFGLQIHAMTGALGNLGQLRFNEVDIGSPSDLNRLTLGGTGSLYFDDSRVYLGRVSVTDNSYCTFEDCYVYWGGPTANEGIDVDGTVTSHQSYLICDERVRVLEGGEFSTYKSYVEAASGYAGYLIDIAGGHYESSTSPIIKGNNTANGILLQNGSIRSAAAETITIDDCGTALECAAAGRLAGPDLTVIGSGNITGWKLSDGGKIAVDDPTGLVATNEVDIDGTVITYSGYLDNAGDWVEGASGSRFHRS